MDYPETPRFEDTACLEVRQLIGLKKSTLLRVLREKGVELNPEAQASLDLMPDTFLKWPDQHLTPPPS